MDARAASGLARTPPSTHLKNKNYLFGMDNIVGAQRRSGHNTDRTSRAPTVIGELQNRLSIHDLGNKFLQILRMDATPLHYYY